MNADTYQHPRRQWLLHSAAACAWAGSMVARPLWAQALSTPGWVSQLRQGGQLQVALYSDNAPYSSAHPRDRSKLQGVDVALAQALAQTLGLQLQVLPLMAGEQMQDDLRHAVWRGHPLGWGPADVMLHVPQDAALAQNVPQTLLCAPYAQDTLAVLHARSVLPQLPGPAVLRGHPIGAERGSAAASALLGFAGGELAAQLHFFDNGVQAAAAVLEGHLHAAWVTRAQAEAALHQRGDSVHDASPWALGSPPLPGLRIQGWRLGMAVKAAHAELGAALGGAVQQLRAGGVLRQIFAQQGLSADTLLV
ncbi:substrate-binding periplasmic protein [Roseateles sp. BYS180W]|uniref:Substrate-binding periplasmic protein n=1 Tax=Roseateles rivi TaxID=3299028 RepID=A0ABW7FRU8_9BURK